MGQVATIFWLGGAVTVLTIMLILGDALRTALREAAAGNPAVIGQFVIVGVLAVIAIRLLTLVNADR